MTNKVPNIRFKGFTDDWEQRKVDEVTTSYSGGTPQAGNSEYYNGTIPFIRSGEIYKNHAELFITQKGLENSSAKMVSRGDILYALYGATSGEVSRSNINGAINQAILAITPNKGYNTDFIVEWFRNEKENIIDKYLQGGQGNLSAQIIKNLEIPFPTFEEQEKVGEIFTELNHLIALHQRKCEQTKELKKYMLQKMFPKKGEKNPEIRFPGFTDDWEQRKFGEMFARRMERNNGEFDNTKWISVARMYYQTPDKVTSNNIDTRTYVMRKGDIAFEGHSNSEFKYGRFVANDIGDGVISELFPIYKHIDKYDLNYWKYAIQLESLMQSKLVKCIEISYTSSNKLDKDSFLKEKIPVASLAEQEKIGGYFSNLDRLITLHQRKCEQLKELKKFMLQNMFPKKG